MSEYKIKEYLLSNNPEFNNYTVCTLFPFPYYSGDILYVANSTRGDNWIVPALQVFTTILFSTILLASKACKG